MKPLRKMTPNGNDVEFIDYQNELWFSQRSISILFGTTTQNISIHLADISCRINTQDLHRKFLVEKAEGSRIIRRNIVHISFELVHAIALRGRYWDELNWLVDAARDVGMLKSHYRVIPVKERDFGDLLIGFLEGIAQIEVQFPVARYRIDFYLPEYCFAIEYDENHHGHPNQLETDSTREIEIRTYIPNIEFIRVREGSEIGGINRVIRKILSKKYNAVLLRKPT